MVVEIVFKSEQSHSSSFVVGKVTFSRTRRLGRNPDGNPIPSLVFHSILTFFSFTLSDISSFLSILSIRRRQNNLRWTLQY